MKTTLKNMTPHQINLCVSDGSEVILEPCGVLPRVATELEDIRPVEVGTGHVPVSIASLGQVTNLPEPISGTVLIVSRMVAEAVPSRRDLMFPLDLIRDSRGRVIGCSRLGQVPYTVKCHQCGDTGIYNAGDMGGSLCYCPCGANPDPDGYEVKTYLVTYCYECEKKLTHSEIDSNEARGEADSPLCDECFSLDAGEGRQFHDPDDYIP